MDERPKFIYGTAWKKEETDDLVFQALKSGFRQFDTAGLPKHYREEAVGNAIIRYFSVTPKVKRSDLFVSIVL
jgi:diketogulonate reductase-like aldo/keto reductase